MSNWNNTYRGESNDGTRLHPQFFMDKNRQNHNGMPFYHNPNQRQQYVACEIRKFIILDILNILKKGRPDLELIEFSSFVLSLIQLSCVGAVNCLRVPRLN